MHTLHAQSNPLQAYNSSPKTSSALHLR